MAQAEISIQSIHFCQRICNWNGVQISYLLRSHSIYMTILRFYNKDTQIFTFVLTHAENCMPLSFARAYLNQAELSRVSSSYFLIWMAYGKSHPNFEKKRRVFCSQVFDKHSEISSTHRAPILDIWFPLLSLAWPWPSSAPTDRSSARWHPT